MALQLRVPWRPMPLRLAVAHGLGQAPPRQLKVVIVDANGRPIGGADVELLRLGGANAEVMASKADSQGIATFEAPSGPVEIRAIYKDLTISRRLNADEVASGNSIFLQFQICVSEPLIRPVDVAIIGSATALILAGSYFKIRPLETVGEIAVGAAIFSFIYRLQCL